VRKLPIESLLREDKVTLQSWKPLSVALVLFFNECLVTWMHNPTDRNTISQWFEELMLSRLARVLSSGRLCATAWAMTES
jgi:hypothetical protein